MAATGEPGVKDGAGFTIARALGSPAPVAASKQRYSKARSGSQRMDPSARRRLEREATERGLRALDEMQRRFQAARITDEDVEQAIREVRGQA